MATAKKTKTKQIKETPKPAEVISEVPVAEPAVPSVDANAPLKIDAVEEKEENEPQEKLNKRLYVLGGIILTLIILGVFGFIFLYIRNLPEEKNIAAPVVTQESVPAFPSAAPVLVRSEWTFEVLNGAGVAGVARKAADELEELGYKVISIDNADKQTYKGNGLFISEEMEDKADLLVADLKDAITIATIAGILKDSTASARLIIGAE